MKRFVPKRGVKWLNAEIKYFKGIRQRRELVARYKEQGYSVAWWGYNVMVFHRGHKVKPNAYERSEDRKAIESQTEYIDALKRAKRKLKKGKKRSRINRVETKRY